MPFALIIEKRLQQLGTNFRNARNSAELLKDAGMSFEHAYFLIFGRGVK